MKYSKKALEDLYNGIAGKPVAQRKHLNVLGEAKVTIDYGQGNVQSVEMADEEAKKLLRLSKSEETEDYKLWAVSAGWDTEAAQFALDNRLKSIYSKTIQLDNKGVRDTLHEEISMITNLKDKGELNVLSSALKSGLTNFKRHIEKLAASRGFRFITNSSALDNIAQITFEEGSVGVGPGEAVVTLFSEGKNPDEGDIVLPNGELVELKAGAGRAGKGKTLSLIRKFNDFIKSNKGRAPLDKDRVNSVMSAIANNDFSQAPTSSQGVINRVLKSIKDIDDIELKVKAVYKDINKSYFQSIVDDQNISVIDHIKEFVDQIKANNEKEGGSANRFFATAEIDTLLQGLSLFASSPEDAAPVIQNALRQNTNADQGAVARAIAAAMQIVEYHNEEKESQKFTYFTLFNKDSFNMLTLGPFTSSYKENVTRTINDMIEHIDGIGISPNTGGGRGGYNLTLK